MHDLTAAIDAAESACEAELERIMADLEALADRAKKVRDLSARLTRCRDEGARIERNVRHAAEALRGPQAREPQAGNGESVDLSHLKIVNEAR